MSSLYSCIQGNFLLTIFVFSVSLCDGLMMYVKIFLLLGLFLHVYKAKQEIGICIALIVFSIVTIWCSLQYILNSSDIHFLRYRLSFVSVTRFWTNLLSIGLRSSLHIHVESFLFVLYPEPYLIRWYWQVY